MWFFIGIVVLIAVAAFKWKNFQLPKGGPDMPLITRFLAKGLALVVVAAFLLTFLSDCIVIVPAGARGVVFDVLQGGVKPKALGEGLNFIIPFQQEATLMDVRVQKAEFNAAAASKDLQTVHAKIAVNFNPDPAAVPQLYREVGLLYAEKVIHPALQEALKASSARYTAEELITKREQVKQDIHQHLATVLTRSNIKLLETYITDFEFSPEFGKAIELKQVAEQQALKARRDLDRIKIEAEQAVVTSRAQAEALKMQRDAVTTQLIELRKVEMQKSAIEKWDGKLPEVMLGNSTPFVDISQFAGKK